MKTMKKYRVCFGLMSNNCRLKAITLKYLINTNCCSLKVMLI